MVKFTGATCNCLARHTHRLTRLCMRMQIRVRIRIYMIIVLMKICDLISIIFINVLLLASPTEPEFAVQIAESFLVVFPVAIEVDRAVLPSLENLTKTYTIRLLDKCCDTFSRWNLTETVTQPLSKCQVLSKYAAYRRKCILWDNTF